MLEDCVYQLTKPELIRCKTLAFAITIQLHSFVSKLKML